MPLIAMSHCSYFTLLTGVKTIIKLFFDCVFTCCVVAPFAFVLSNYTSLDIVTVFFLVQMTEIIKAIIGITMVKSGVWAQNIVDKM